jgi:hypothetical protein
MTAAYEMGVGNDFDAERVSVAMDRNELTLKCLASFPRSRIDPY